MFGKGQLNFNVKEYVMKVRLLIIAVLTGAIAWSSNKFDKVEDFDTHIKVNEANIKHLMKGQDEIKQLIKENHKRITP